MTRVLKIAAAVILLAGLLSVAFLILNWIIDKVSIDFFS